MVSALDSGSRGPDSSPGRVIVLCSWAKHFTLTVPLSIQEYKWVPANCQVNLTNSGDYLRWTSVPFNMFKRSNNTSCYGYRDKLWK